MVKFAKKTFRKKTRSKTLSPRKGRTRVVQLRAPVAKRRVVRVPPRLTSLSGGMTESITSFGRSRPLHKGIARFGAPCHYVINRSGQSIPAVTDLASQQKTLQIATWNSMPDIVNVSQAAPETPGNATFNYANEVRPTKFHMGNLKGEIMFQNPSSATIILDIYECLAKRDIPTSGTTANIDVYDPISAWSVGMKQQSVTPTGYAVLAQDASSMLGSKPTDSALFNDFYKITNKRSVVMQQASTHLHKVSLRLGKNFDKSQVACLQEYLAGLANFTYFTFVVVRGLPVTNVQGAVTVSNVPALRWVTSENYTATWLQPQGAVWYGQQLMGSDQYSTLATLQLNNPSSGGTIVS